MKQDEYDFDELLPTVYKIQSPDSDTIGDVSSFTYNGFIDRYTQKAGVGQQIVNSATTTYQLDLAAGLVNVLADGGNTYLYGNTVVAQVSNTQTGYYTQKAGAGCRMYWAPYAR